MHWLGGDDAGPYAPTWEPIESFNGADEHWKDTLGRVRRGETTAPKDLATIRPSNSTRTWSNKRVRARVFVEVDGVEVPIFKDGTMVVNPYKTLTSNLPYVMKYDHPFESEDTLPTTKPLVIVVERRPQVWHSQLASDGDRNL